MTWGLEMAVIDTTETILIPFYLSQLRKPSPQRERGGGCKEKQPARLGAYCGPRTLLHILNVGAFLPSQCIREGGGARPFSG